MIFYILNTIAFMLLIAMFIYRIYKIRVGLHQPHPFTWFTYFIAGLIMVFFLFHSNADLYLTIQQSFYVLGCGITAFYGLYSEKKYGRQNNWKIRKFDFLFLFISISSIILYYINYEYLNIAVVILLVGQISTELPTTVKNWKAPFTEMPLPDYLESAKCLILGLLITNWTLPAIITTFVWAGINLMIAIYCQWRQYIIAKEHHGMTRTEYKNKLMRDFQKKVKNV